MKFSSISLNQLLVLIILIILMLSDLSHQKSDNNNNNNSLTNNLIELSMIVDQTNQSNLSNKPINYHNQNQTHKRPGCQLNRTINGRNIDNNNNNKNNNPVIDYDLTKLDIQNLTHIITFYNDYKTLFNKSYKTKQEEEERVGLFKETIVSINKHNSDDCSHYIQGINDMSDMKWSEIQKKKLGLKRDNQNTRNNTKKRKREKMLKSSPVGVDNTTTTTTTIPLEFDWRKYGTVTPTKNQQINCQFNRQKTTGADDELASAIYTYGPVIVSFDVTENFANYKSGIFEEPLSDANNSGHYMVAVGYTPECFILKNSWGNNWGEDGFARVSRSMSNSCGIGEHDYYYPVLTNVSEPIK